MITPREYQTRGLDAARRSFVAGARAVLMVGPTGMGKTTLGGLAVRGRVERGGKVAWYAHRRELITQAADRLRLFGLDVGCFGEGAAAPVQVVSVQTVLARKQLPDADLVVLDEAHHYVSDEWNAIPKTHAAHGSLMLGLTATPERGDGRGLGVDGESWGFDDLIVVAQIRDLQALGFLCACEVMAPRGNVKKLAMDPHEAWERYAPGRAAVVFAPDVPSARAYADGFAQRGIGVHVITGEMPGDERDDALARFAAGAIPVLVNVNVLTEGWDCPRAKVCILARKFGSPSLYLQSIGRVLRPWEDQTALLLDLCGNVTIHGRPEDEREFSLDGLAVTRKGDNRDGIRLCKVCKCEIPPESATCPECATPADERKVAHGEGVELDRWAWAKQMPTDKRVDKLARFYLVTLEKGHKPGAAEFKYRAVFGHFPPGPVRVQAWAKAQAQFEKTRGDAWEPPLAEVGNG